MAFRKEDRTAAFRAELETIQDPAVRHFTMECLQRVPEYFFVNCPSSSTGKHHPEDELNGKGTVLHSKRVCRLVPAVAEAYDIGGNIDLMLSAAILHDSFKYGHHKAQQTTRDHPLLAADSMAQVYKEKGGEIGIARTQAEIIYKCIRYHMGKWGGTEKCRKALCDFSREEMVVHLCDVTASKKYVRVNIN